MSSCGGEMAKKPIKTQAKAKKTLAAKPKAKAAVAKTKPVKKLASAAKEAGKPSVKPKVKASEKNSSKTAVKAVGKVPVKVPPAKASAKQEVSKSKVVVEKPNAAKPKKAPVPSVMGSKLKKDADELEDDFLDDDIEVDPELAEFVEDVAELEEADAAAEKAIAGGAIEEDEDEVVTPLKKSPKEKSASERRMKKERDLLSGIDRNGDLSEIWQKFFDTHKNEKAKSYNMRESFEAKSSLQHVKLGWGFILSNINDRLEVLFKEGIKILISNYKS